MKYFFDAYAILALIQGNENYRSFTDALLVTNTLHLAEVYHILLRDIGEENAMNIIQKLNFEYLEISPKIAIAAAKLKYIHRKANLSYGDCIGYETAKRNNLLFLTGDQAFAKFDNVEFVK